jgi:hypothetical protein
MKGARHELIDKCWYIVWTVWQSLVCTLLPSAPAHSLRKVRADNTRYYGYGTWDSYEDLRDHVESK